jgi:processive 1,2-diacylglycerol beta-glucosyltransferase
VDRDKVILVLTASAGGGHLIAGHALAHALRAGAPGAEVEVIDALALTNALFRQAYAGTYLQLVQHAPAAFGWLYEAMDRPGGGFWDAARGWIQNLNMAPVVRHILGRRPALIVNTHYLPAEIVAHMRRAGQLACPQVTVTTDYETHRMWVQEPTERYYTATEEGKTYLTTWGVEPQRILVTGIPVRPGFEQALGRAVACQRCGLDPGAPVVLVLCGGFGVGPITAMFRELVHMAHQAQIVVIVGRNEALRAKLERFVAGVTLPLRVVGFTDQVHEWMQAADVVVTKPGGLTVAEALASALPIVIVNPIPGQETRNSDYLLEHGAALKVSNLRMLARRIHGLLSDPHRLDELRAAARGIARPHAAHDIAADALTFLPP